MSRDRDARSPRAAGEAPAGDPLRALAQERGRLLAEIGVRPEDSRWAQMEAEALASLVTPSFPMRVPAALARVWRTVRRWAG